MTSPELQALLDSITPDQQAQIELQLLAVSARGDDVDAVCDFGEVVFGKVAAKHHRQWIEHILSHPRTAMTAPPSSAKTTWITTITMAWWIGKHPMSSNGIGSAGDDAAQAMAAAIANTIELNPRWKLVFPDIVPDKETGWSSKGYHIKDQSDAEWARKRYGDKNASLTTGGVGSAVWNGLRISNDGLLVLDDIHDLKSKTQQATNDNTVDWFKYTAENRLENNARMAVVQTRWNPKDVIANVLTRPDFKVFQHPAIYTDKAGNEQSYWPKVRPLETLIAIRERDMLAFELQFQGNDKALQGHLLKAEWLHYTAVATIAKEWNRYLGIDPAKRVKDIIKKNDDPDNFEIMLYADTGVRLVVEDVFGGVLFGPDAIDLYFEISALYHPVSAGIETNGLGNEYFVNIQKEMRRRRVMYNLQPIHSAVDLVERLSTLSPYFKSSQILVSDAATPGLQRFVAQWLSFPKGHDDTLSAAHIGWRVAGHLLPVEHPQDKAERLAAVPNTQHPARAIEMAYGVN